jgi:hypothetical protein
VTDIPPEQFGEKKPNFNLLRFRMGDCFRPMKPQATRLQDFPQLITCALCLKIQIVQVLWTMKRWKAKYAGDVRKRSTDGATLRRIDQGVRRAVDAPFAEFNGG